MDVSAIYNVAKGNYYTRCRQKHNIYIRIVSSYYQSYYTQVAQCTEVRFAFLLSSGFITAILSNPPERKLTKCTSVKCVTYKKYGQPAQNQPKFQFLFHKNCSLRNLCVMTLISTSVCLPTYFIDSLDTAACTVHSILAAV